MKNGQKNVDGMTPEEQDEFLREATKSIKLEMTISDQLGLAIGSGRAELVPTEERVKRDLNPEHFETDDEKALCKNLISWITLACEGTRVLIEKKEELEKERAGREAALEANEEAVAYLRSITQEARRATHCLQGQNQWPEDGS